ncbi:MAG: Long chronological lifespan protein 2 [Peltula sp. TS41687]|nr:MAG: Long chronological lifespan protein 2 [Peltula sp. TS41687]
MHLLTIFVLLPPLALGQFHQFFEHMFQHHDEAHQAAHQQAHQQAQQQRNVPSDSNWYRQNYENGTLACVHFPHHCPCAFPDVEEKFELADGSAICVSKGGSREDQAKRKVEMVRKGWL